MVLLVAGWLVGGGREAGRLNAPHYSDMKELNFLASRSLTDNICMSLFLIIIYMNFIYLFRSSNNNYGAIIHANGVT